LKRVAIMRSAVQVLSRICKGSSVPGVGANTHQQGMNTRIRNQLQALDPLRPTPITRYVHSITEIQSTIINLLWISPLYYFLHDCPRK
jgi:hypothetical protein